jgi:ribonuclease HII
MGYGTKKHIEGIKKYGLSKFHRKTFKIKQLN